MKIALEAAAAELAANPSALFVKLFGHGTMSVEFYQPGEADLQQPHQQDELYFIASGSGEFVHEAARYDFKKGDLIFVPAGDKHRFVNYSSDFATWVIFYGKQGGEKLA